MMLATAMAPPLAAQTVAQGAEAPEATAAPPPPTAPVVTLPAGAAERDPRTGRIIAPIAAPPEAAAHPVLGPGEMGGPARRLRGWVAEGRAAGLAGVFYDNRDDGHSRLSPTRFPQITHIAYDEALRTQGAHRSLALRYLFPGPVLGNASLAITRGPRARSLPRLAMTTPGVPMSTATGYFANQLYVYPGHRDVRDGRDVLPAMLPYFVISLGSSGSDRPVLEALAMALAALPPETRARAEAEGLLAPTLHMILRRSLEGVTDYLSPAAHPAAVHRQQLRPAVMMSTANALTPETIPPVVALRVLQEDFAQVAGLAGRSERLFDTPAAVARLWRGWDGRREMVVSTAGTRDPNGRELEIRWVLVAGDPDRVRIEPLDPAGRRVRLMIDWHDVPFRPTPEAFARSRVEIAAIAWNGAHYGAPSFVTVAFPDHQARTYAPDPDGRPRLVSIDYRAAAGERGFDPELWWQAAWRDVAIRDDTGRLIGWRREAEGAGRTIITPPDHGQYRLAGADRANPTLQWAPATD